MQPFCVIITSINGSDNKILKEYARLCPEKKAGFILAGDTKSPADFDLPGCEFLGIDTQKQLPFRLARLLPDRNYAKKNIAYLQAIKKGYTVLVETDDDNLALPEFWEQRNIQVEGDPVDTGDWVNVYRYFSELNIWPRGFSLNKLKAGLPATSAPGTFFCPVQQGLADENPDVDAIYRLSLELPIYFNKRKPVVLGAMRVCPFNSQNTTWFREAFPLLYLPSYCSFRMTDIWRSFIAQRILWTCGWHLSFHNATVTQERNAHDLIKDFEDEISGYLHNHTIVEDLAALELKAGQEHLYDNLRSCYQLLTQKGHIGREELPLLEAWISDLQSLA